MADNHVDGAIFLMMMFEGTSKSMYLQEVD